MSRDDAFEAWRRRALEADILEVALSGIVKAKLRKKSREHVGACPMCGGGSNVKGKQRVPDGFAVNSGKRVFNCRRGGAGGDVIAMVMHTLGVPFLAACEMITGEPPPAQGSVISEETKKKTEELKEEAAERERRRIEDDNIYRQREIRTVRDIHDHAHPFDGSSAELYAGIRALRFPPVQTGLSPPFKCVEAMPYHVDKDTIVHRGPAMVASIVNSKRKFQGVHFTYIDLASEKGKLQLEYKGEPLDPKKSRGSKQGNFVPICGPVDPTTLVLGEAIEKGVAVWMALESTGRDLSATAFWSACDLGNLAGKASATVAHPTIKAKKTGRAIKVPNGSPDLTSPSIEIPDTVTDLVLLGDSTSDPFTTRLAMTRAAARYERPGRLVRIAWAPDGVDFDDLLREARGDDEATAAALQRIAGVIDAAAPSVVDDFVPDPSAIAEAIRRFGLAELDAAIAIVRSAEGEARRLMLQASGQRLGQLVGAGAIEEPFAIAMLDSAALACGLIGEDGAKAVRKAISEAIKLGKKQPRDLSEVRGDAIAALRALHDQRRPREAADHVISPSTPDSFEPSPSSPHGAEDVNQTLASPSSSLASDPPAPSATGGSSNRQTLADIEKIVNDRKRAIESSLGLDHSDTDNGKRLISYFGDDLLVRKESGTATGTWLGWAGTHWDIDNGSALAAIFAQLVGDIIMEEANFLEATKSERAAIEDGKTARVAMKAIADPERGDQAEIFDLKRRIMEGDAARSSLSKRKSARRKHGLATKNRARMGAMLECAGPHLRRSPDDFNADPMLVATRTHTLRFAQAADPECPDPDVVRLKWGCHALSEHRRADLLTGVVPVNFDPDADCPLWRANLERFQPNEAQRRTVQQFAGLGLLGKPIQRVMFHYGSGGNFKSVFLETITRVLGDSFAIGLPTESIIGGAEGSAGGARPDLERVFGKRMLRILELPSGVSLKADMIKKLTGGEKWPVRTLYKGFFEFVPLAKPHMSGNDYPQFDGSDGGMRRRLLVVEWPIKIPEAEQRDFDIVVGELMEEASGILNWMIDGAIDYLENGLVVSEDTKTSTDEYFDEMDPTAMFIRDCIVEQAGESVGARAMYLAYKAHCEANARRAIFETKFGRIMKKKFKRDDKRTHKYLDVTLRDVPQTGTHDGDSSGDPRDGYVNRDMEV